MKLRFLLTIWLLFIIAITSGQPDCSLAARNKLTIYVIPSKIKYDWSSPHSLYKSYRKNYEKNILKKERYILGHAFIELITPHDSCGRILAGMCSAGRGEQKEMVFKEHYGLAILGADTQGKLETSTDLDYKVEKYSRKGQMAFMSFFISDEAAERMVQFYHAYKAGIDSNGSCGARYGGAFWPRYKGEGSGCSAFVVSFLDLAGILKNEFDKWMVKINIPMDLIGGPYNQNKEVRLKEIKKRKSWAESDDGIAAGYESFQIFDPFLIYEWIQDEWEEQNSRHDLSLATLRINRAKGILFDSRNQPLPDEENIFLERENHSIFIDYFLQKYSGGK